jgi:hypothetical protein
MINLDTEGAAGSAGIFVPIKGLALLGRTDALAWREAIRRHPRPNSAGASRAARELRSASGVTRYAAAPMRWTNVTLIPSGLSFRTTAAA